MAEIQKIDLGKQGIKAGSPEAIIAMKLNELIDSRNNENEVFEQITGKKHKVKVLYNNKD